jgi:thymidylate synthase ThyX
MKARDIYLLNPKELSPEVIAVAFAKTSRSPESFREIAAGLTDEKSAEFHDKWVVGYGHASVAEHAVLHLALENVSRLAIRYSIAMRSTLRQTSLLRSTPTCIATRSMCCSIRTSPASSRCAP